MTEELASDVVPTIAEGVAWVAVESEVVLVGEDRWVYLIRAPGALLVPLLDGSVTAGELADDVAEVFGLDRHTAWSDVSGFLASMAERGLVAVA